MSEDTPVRTWTRPHIPFVIVALAFVAFAVAACSSSAGPAWTFGPVAIADKSPAPTGSPGAAASATPAASTTPAPSTTTGEPLGTIKVEAFDLGFTPNAVEVSQPGTYNVEFTNTGTILHDLTFADGTKVQAQAGQTAQGQVTVPAGGIGFICSIPGHEQAGMSGAVSVAGAAPSPSPSDSASGHGGPAAALPSPDPNAPAPEVYDPTAPKVLDGDVHDITLTIEEKMMTVAKGYQVAVWSFNGIVPGPVIRVKLGDTVRVHLVNPATNKLPHSVDFHASQVAWNDEMTSINPGEEKLYEWRADYAGVWMYHCGTAPALHHIANGMYGMVIVEPKGGFEPVDKEFALVQSDWYFGGQGLPVDLSKAGAGAPSPDWVTFNGVASQYVDSPIKIDTGKRVRVFMLDAGPNIDSSFHVVGTIFDKVVKEGVVMSSSDPGHWGSQAVDLSPAQGAVIEFTAAEDGLYPIVTHAFNFPGRGALGLFQAGDGDPKN